MKILDISSFLFGALVKFSVFIFFIFEAARRNYTLLRSPIEGCMVNRMVNSSSNLVLQHNQDERTRNNDNSQQYNNISPHQQHQHQQPIDQLINNVQQHPIELSNNLFYQFLPENILNSTLQWTKSIACFNGKQCDLIKLYTQNLI